MAGSRISGAAVAAGSRVPEVGVCVLTLRSRCLGLHRQRRGEVGMHMGFAGLAWGERCRSECGDLDWCSW